MTRYERVEHSDHFGCFDVVGGPDERRLHWFQCILCNEQFVNIAEKDETKSGIERDLRYYSCVPLTEANEEGAEEYRAWATGDIDDDIEGHVGFTDVEL